MQKDQLASEISGFSREILSWAGIAYASGLLIVNANLARYDVVSIEIFRSEYVAAGALYLFLVFLTRASLESALAGFSDGMDRWKGGARWYPVVEFALMGFVAVFGPAMALVLLSRFEMTYNVRTSWYGLASLYVMVNQLGFLSTLLKGTSASQSTGVSPDSLPRVHRLHRFSAFNTVTQMLLSVSMYAFFAFPALQPEFGGGKRPSVTLVVEKSALALLEAGGAPLNEAHSSAGPVRLVLETDQFVAFSWDDLGAVNGKPKSMRIRRDLVLAVIPKELGPLGLPVQPAPTPTPPP